MNTQNDSKYYSVGKYQEESHLVFGTSREIDLYLQYLNRDAVEPGSYYYADEIDEPIEPELSGVYDLYNTLTEIHSQIAPLTIEQYIANR